MEIHDKETDSIIKYLSLKKRFINIDSIELKKYQKDILDKLSLAEIYDLLGFDVSSSYNHQVSGRTHELILYVVLSIYNKSTAGQKSLKHLKIAKGFVGSKAHNWIVLSNEYILDLSLSQFTNMVIPKVSLLKISDAIGLYEEKQRFIIWSHLKEC